MEVKPSPSQRNSGRWSEPIPRELGRREAVPGVAGLTEGQRRPRPGPSSGEPAGHSVAPPPSPLAPG